ETGYGYIEPGAPLGRGPARAVRRFFEKPSPARARRFLASGRYLWNAGVFAWKAAVFLDEVEEHLPDVTAALRGRLRTGPQVRAAYRKLRSISVDVGVLERSRRVGVLPARFAWDDLGTWAGLARLDPDFRKGHVLAWESPDTIVWAESGTVAVIGVPRAVVVRSGENVLVASLDRAQEVRGVAQILRKDNSRKRSRRVEP
ncbi:MAG TPA: sugar phosphate nucleotidyltransferase, partial [Candidatus Eisenbacteria bacterium]|nr:sugar phosphate nucleotidyltransferase [Candidatus Eisenbacteria bacterium]